MKSIRRFAPALAVVALLARAVFAQGPVADPDPARFQDEIKAFADWDAKNATPAHAVLFAGSSSIRFWMTGLRFPALPVINRGFGGAHISDVNFYLQQTVLKYDADVIVFYCGDNDIADGKTPERVAADYRTFVERVLAAHPKTEILFIDIKPSILRWALWPEMQQANDLVAAYSRTRPNLHVVDTAARLLGPDGKPIPSLFRPDGLHLTEAGYDIWTAIVRPEIRNLLPRPAGAAQ